jgi:hypothetical protein
MKNKANFKLTSLVHDPWVMRLASWVLCLFNPFMQNKPNFKPRSTIKMKKQTQFSYQRHRRNTQTVQIYPQLLQLFTRLRRTFAQKMQKMRAFCKFLKLTHLRLYTTNTYKTFSHPVCVFRLTHPAQTAHLHTPQMNRKGLK